MIRRTDPLALVRGGTRRRPALLEEPIAHLHTQNARNRIIDTTLRNIPRTHLRDGIPDELLPVRRHHEEIDTGVDGPCATRLRATLHFVDPIPVAHDETVEAETPLQYIRQQILLAVKL